MPRSKEGVKRTPLDEQTLKQALEAVNTDDPEKKMSYREASKVFNISRSTLTRHSQNFKNNTDYPYSPNYAVKQVFSKEEELSLVVYLKNIAKMQYGLTKKGVRILAFKYATANEKKIPDTWNEEEIAGEEWMRGFMKRHAQELSICKPEATSLSRMTSFNRANVELFFNNIKEVHRKYGPISPDKIWNLDETGLSTVQGQSRIVAPKGVKQIGSVTSAERGCLVTVIAAVNAIGNSLPPMLIFPRVHFKERMLFGGPVGCIGTANQSGWSNEESFLKFLDHFLNAVKSSKEDRVLLILDNHETHLSPTVLDKASDRGIVIVTFPPHTSHRLQPLDLSVYGPLKTYYNQAVEGWLLSNKGKTFDIYSVAEVLGTAYPKAFTPNNILSGFRKSGIFPFNEGIFTDDDYLCSYVTDRPSDTLSTVTSSSLDNVPPTSSEPESSIFLDPLPSTPSNSLASTSSEITSCPPVPGTSKALDLTPPPDVLATATPNEEKIKTFLSPEEVQPYPKAEERKRKKQGRKPGRTMIATETPEKNAIKQQKSKKVKSKIDVNKIKKLQEI